MHILLVWHRDADSYLDGYEVKISFALICMFFGLNIVGCDGGMLV